MEYIASNKKKQTSYSWKIIHKYQKHFAKRKIPEIKQHILNLFIYIKF